MVRRIVRTRLPARGGAFELYAYEEDTGGRVHLALVKGEIGTASQVLVRIHSECLTGDVFHSLRCDCGEQLDTALKRIQAEEAGIFIYLRQEGRGIGLVEKLRAYELQDRGLDTVEANAELGFQADQRDYEAAVSILHDLQVTSVRLLTNNPMKVSELQCSTIKVSERVPLETQPNHENANYLRTKRDRLGHLLDLRD
ncbi:MAG: GTP cyclohydrolase II [Candidatus Neomarinimicrobiota bacterium]